MSRCTEWIPSLWLETFDELLNEDNQLDYSDRWTLNFNYSQAGTLTKEEKKRGWKICNPCAFGSFQCAQCGNTWNSARVGVLFRYRLRNERGSVIMRPFGQSCRECYDDEFYLPGFTEKEVEYALLRLFSKIRKNCYGEDEGDEGGSRSHPNKRTKPHERDLCEACQMGICCQDDE